MTNQDLTLCHGWGQRWPRPQGHRSHPGQESRKVWPGPWWLIAEGKKTLGENSLEKLPGFPRVAGRRGTLHQHPSHCLQRKLSCFGTGRGHTDTPTSGFRCFPYFSKTTFSPTKTICLASPRPLRPLGGSGGRDTGSGWPVRGTGLEWPGSQALGQGKGSQARKEAEPAGHHHQRGVQTSPLATTLGLLS